MNQDIIVSVNCLAYNHEPYIRDCLEGFIMQKTNFLFEVLVHDDASTDKTADIIREYETKYPDIIKPIYQTENQYSKGIGVVRTFQYPRAKGEYIAICEGDDYWTDPYKLQKQVDFLDENPEFGLVFTDIDIFYQKQQQLKQAVFSNGIVKLHHERFEDFLIHRGYAAPCTWLFREELLSIIPEKRYCDGTFIIMLEFIANSKVKYLPEVTTVYRSLEESASHTKNLRSRYSYKLGVFGIQKEYMEKYKLSDRVQIEVLRSAYMHLFPISTVLKDKQMVIEIRKFLKKNATTTKERICCLMGYMPWLSRTVLCYLFKKKGYHWL